MALQRHQAGQGLSRSRISAQKAGATASSVPADIRIQTSFDSSVSSLSAANQALVKSTVATAVLVLKKFYKVNAPRVLPLTVAADCSNGCGVPGANSCPLGTPPFYSVPAELKNGTGVANTDLFIVVLASFKDSCDSTVAWGFSCYFDDATSRPLQGFINVCSLFFDNKQFAPPLQTRVSTIMHEITHVMGFTSQLFVQLDNAITKAADAYNDTVDYVTTSSIVSTTRTFFNCPTAIGAQLEDQGGDGSAGSHWDYRIFSGELMSPSGGYLLSNFTLNLMAELGWYTPRFFFAAPFVRGMGSGCALLTDTCESVTTKMPNQKFYCVSGATACVDTWDKASCSGINYPFNKPPSCQVTQNYGADNQDDCRSFKEVAFDYASSSSTCMTTKSSGKTFGGCFDTSCTSDNSVVILAHASTGANISILCPSGTPLDLGSLAPDVYSPSTIVTCPDNAAVCATRSCSPTCNATNGQCMLGRCVCYLEWLGIDCNLHVSQVSGTFDTYTPTLPPAPPPSTKAPSPKSPPPSPPYTRVDPSKPQLMATMSSTMNMNFTALNARVGRRALLAEATSVATFQADFIAALAAMLQVPASNINITVVSGTGQQAYINFTALPNVVTVAAANSALAPIVTNPLGTLGTVFITRYGITAASISVISYQMVVLQPPPPSPPSSTTTVEDSGPVVPLGIIIGASVGGTVLILLLVLLIWYCCTKDTKPDPRVHQMPAPGGPQVYGYPVYNNPLGNAGNGATMIYTTDPNTAYYQHGPRPSYQDPAASADSPYQQGPRPSYQNQPPPADPAYQHGPQPSYQSPAPTGDSYHQGPRPSYLSTTSTADSTSFPYQQGAQSTYQSGAAIHSVPARQPRRSM